jgi:uncharacterized OB-fold protein
MTTGLAPRRWSTSGLTLQRCGDCGLAQYYPRVLCSHCGSRQLTTEQASGEAQLSSFTVVHRAPTPGSPYVVALVRLREGPTMVSRVVGVDDAQSLRCDMALRLTWMSNDDQEELAVFTPARAAP